MSPLNKDMVFLILQFLEDEKYKEVVHKLEQVSGLFFNLRYLEEKTLAGEWDELEKYLSGFIKLDDNQYSMKMFFEIRKQKYFEALVRDDKAKALDILMNDLKVFSTYNEEIYKELTHLLTLANFRDNEKLSKYADIKSAQEALLVELKKLVEVNPMFKDKLAFPSLNANRFNWQHQKCKNPRPNPEMETLFIDHTCQPPSAPTLVIGNPSSSQSLLPFPLTTTADNVNALPRWMLNTNPSSSIQATKTLSCSPFPSLPTADDVSPLARWMANANPSSSTQSPALTASSLLGPPNQVAISKHSRTPSNALGMVDYQNTDHGQPMKRLRSAPSIDENPVFSANRIIRSLDDLTDRSQPGELTQIVDPVHCQVVTVQYSTDPSNKVVRLLYTNSGNGFLALGSRGIQKLWKWMCNEQNPTGKATTRVAPQHWQSNRGLTMINDIPNNSEEAVPCMTISSNDSYVMSAFGGKISLFNMVTFKVMTTFMSPPPSPTFLLCHPKDNNLLAIGMEDATIIIYCVKTNEIKYGLKGHEKRITGLAFSTRLHLLVSSSADGQLCSWSTDTWDKKNSHSIQLPYGKAPVGDTRVYFHTDQERLLVCHESQLAIYNASKMELTQLWVPQDRVHGSITFATYSCNSQLVYAAFTDGNIGVFEADCLRLRRRIASSAYLNQTRSNSQNVYPLVVATHPAEPDQFAIGLSNGLIK
ncbi:Topless-related protein 2, partial [Mucuna pruriens]